MLARCVVHSSTPRADTIRHYIQKTTSSQFAIGGSGAKPTLRRRSPEPLSSGFTRKEYAPSASGKAANGWAVAPAGQAEKGYNGSPYQRRAGGVAPYEESH